LEFIDGENFRSRLSGFGGPVPLVTASQWGRELASVIEYLAEHGIVHRDLKPENLIVTEDGRIFARPDGIARGAIRGVEVLLESDEQFRQKGPRSKRNDPVGAENSSRHPEQAFRATWWNRSRRRPRCCARWHPTNSSDDKYRDPCATIRSLSPYVAPSSAEPSASHTGPYACIA
jgi:serine/threonine protein kinase